MLKLTRKISTTTPSQKFSFNHLNKASLLGNIGTEIESRDIQDKKLLSFRLATNDQYKKGTGEVVKSVQWHNIKYFVPKEFSTPENYLKKGAKVYVEGKIEYRQYENEAKEKKNVVDILASDVVYLGMTGPNRQEEEQQ